jgi:antitoxin MazE
MAAVQRWGNSLAVRIPASLAESLFLREGTQVELECKAGVIVVRPKSRPRHKLSQLLRACTPAKLHRESDFGPDVGAEVID